MKTPAVLLLLATCGCLFSTVAAATEEKFTKTFAVDAGGALVVEVDYGAITVTGDAGQNGVSVDVWRKVSRQTTAEEQTYLHDFPVEITQSGSTVTIKVRNQRGLSWFSAWRNRNEAHYTVRLPASFRAQLSTSGGPISVAGLEGSVTANSSGGSLDFARLRGELTGHTSGGRIKVSDSQGDIRIDTSGGGIEVTGGGGSLQADTSGGGITVRSFAGPAKLHTSGGGITVEEVRGAVRGDTSGGPVHALLVDPLPGDVDLSTSGGRVSVTIAAGAAFNLDASSSGGSVTCELPLTVQGKLERDRARGPVNGGGPTVRLHSSGGGVHIRKR